jgi:hypothetical protein
MKGRQRIMKNPLRVYVLSAERTICEQEMLKKTAQAGKTKGPLRSP